MEAPPSTLLAGLALSVVALAATPLLQAQLPGTGGSVIVVPDSAKDAIVINGNRGNHVVEAGGRDVAINGNGNQVAIRGGCRALTVAGNENSVEAGQVATISALGNRNRVTWTGSISGETPQIASLGTDNAVTRQPTP